jgi:3-deoxy-7-phosphoheptulonate synthase
MFKTQDLHVREIVRLSAPRTVKTAFPATPEAVAAVALSRERIIRILRQEDPRLLVVVGPCSIHDERSALEYASRLAKLRAELADRMEIVMRVYFEKPRTTIGWKGLINDPHLDGSEHIEEGIQIARRLLVQITGMGLPAGTEFLDPIVPQYIADLISWAAIGARTTESQTHREMASGLSMRWARPGIAIVFSALIRTASPAWCAPAAIQTDTWCCGAAGRARITTRPASPMRKPR